MNLKEWLNKTANYKTENPHNFRVIDYVCGQFTGKDGTSHNMSNHVDELMIDRHPSILNAEVIEDKVYDSEYSTCTLNLKETGRGKCKEYYCRLNAEQVEKALKTNYIFYKKHYLIKIKDPDVEGGCYYEIYKDRVKITNAWTLSNAKEFVDSFDGKDYHWNVLA